jgi:HEAT repeat protein
MRMLAAFLALAVVAAGQDDPKKQAEKEAEAKAKQRIDAFKASIKKAKTNDDFISALGGLGDEPHPLVLNELKIWCGNRAPEIRQAAAEEVGKFKGDEKAAAALLLFAKNEKVTDAAVKFILEAGKIDLKKTAKDFVPFFSAKQWEIAREAVDACGTIKSKTVVSQLISFLEDLEAEKERLKQAQSQQQGGGTPLPGGQPLPGGGGTQQGNDIQERQKRVDELMPRVVQALKDITDEKKNTAAEWRKYEAKNRGLLKDEEPKKEEKK